MKNIIYILFTFLLLSFSLDYSYAQPVDCGEEIVFSWVKTLGSISDDEIKDITTDSQGYIYITGFFSGNMVLQSVSLISYGEKDFFVAKLDSFGNLIWIRSGGGAQDDFATSVTLDSNGNVFILGSYNGTITFGTNPQNTLSPLGNKDVFAAKYSSDGSLLWYKRMGGDGEDFPGKLCVDYSDNVIITGSFSNYFRIEGGGMYLTFGGTDHFIVKLDNSGEYLWNTEFGSVSDDFGLDIVSDRNNNIYILGEFYGSIYFGSRSLVSDGGKDIFLLKINNQGYYQWAHKAGGAGINDRAGALTVDNLDNVYFCYYDDVALNKLKVNGYSSLGVAMLNINTGQAGDVYPGDIAVDRDGYIYMVGAFANGTNFGDGNSASNGDYDYFLVKYNSAGVLSYKHIAGGNFSDVGNCVWVDEQFKIHTGGFFNNSINLNNTAYNSVGLADAMLLKYDKYLYFGETAISSINCNPSNMCIDISVLGGDDPFTYNWSNGINTEDQCGLATGSYTVSVTDNTGCQIVTAVNVIAPSQPVIPLPSSISACPFDTVTLDAGGGFADYLWSNGQRTSSILVYNQGTYSVSVVDNNSCTASKSVNITKLPNIAIFTNDQLRFCDGETAVTTISGYSSYLWSDGSTASSFETDAEGDYWVKVFDGNCFYYDTLYVRKYPPNPLNLGNDRIICEGDSVLITIPATYASYLWNDGSTSRFYWAKQAGTLNLQAIDGFGCKYEGSVDIATTPRPIVDLEDFITMCTDDGYTLETNNPYPNTTYLWSTGSTQSEILVTVSGYYYVTATSTLGGCTVSGSAYVTIYPEPHVDLGGEIKLCEGESKEIIADGDFVSILWSDGSTGSSIYVYGEEDIWVSVMDNNGCLASDTAYSFIYPVEYPSLGNDTVLCEGDKIYLSPQNEYYRYLWSNGSTLPYVELTEPGRYSVTVYNEAECSDSASIYLASKPKPVINDVESQPGGIYIAAAGGTLPYSYSLDGRIWQSENVFHDYESGNYIAYVMDINYCMATMEFFFDKIYKAPNFFTPNSDGYNDYWTIYGLYHFPNAVVKVFDRFGKELFEFGNGSLGWDGTYLGEPLPSDTYWYVIDFGGGRDSKKGSVTLKR